MGSTLKPKGYRLGVATNGKEALSQIEKETPDLILLDVMMPEMDGYEVCRQLKNMDETKDVPVIFISAPSETPEKIKGFEAGGVDYITKPFQKEDVFARVNVHLELRQAKDNLEKAFEQSEREREAAETANKKITDSIQYARMIQSSLLSDPENLKSFFPDSFIIWKPRDIVC